jgi:hypothetical protein
MNLEKFDQEIKNKLSEVEVPYEASTWELLSKKMDVAAPPVEPEHAPANAFDEAMRQRLEAFEAPFQSNHWALMAQRLDTRVWVQQLRRHKLIESALIALIVLNFQAVWRSTHAIIDWAIPPAETAPVTPATPKMPMAKAGKNNHKTTAATADEAALDLLPMHQHPFRNDCRLPSVIIPEGLVATPPQIGSIATTMLGADGQPVSAKPAPLNLLAALIWEPLNFNRQPQPMAGIIKPQRQTRKAGSQDYIAAFGQFNRAKLSDPNSGYNTSANWAGAGVLGGKRKGKWGVEAGLALQEGTFAPEKDIFSIEKINGQHVGIAIAHVNTQVLNVPAKITRQIVRHGRTSVHATAGGTAIVALQKSYQFSETPMFNVPSQSGGAVDRPTANGWAEGGAFNENAVLTADLGLRVEQRINPRFTAYIEPAYQRQLAGKGFGPVAMRRQGFAVQAGVLAQL